MPHTDAWSERSATRTVTGRLTIVALAAALLLFGQPLVAADAAIPPAATAAIAARYRALGGAGGVLGAAKGEVIAVHHGYARIYAHGRIYDSAETGAHEVRSGVMLDYYLKLGATDSGLGLPISSVYGGGRGSTVQSFAKGRIYYAKATGAHGVYGTTLARYLALGGAGGVLGLPTVGSKPARTAGVRVSIFQGGRIWANAVGAHEVRSGPLLTYYLDRGADASALGLPAHPQFAGLKSSTVQTFAHGRIYYAKSTGAHPVYGAVLTRYRELDGPGGPLGLPTVGPKASRVAGVAVTRFQTGRIFEGSKVGGVREVAGAIDRRYDKIGAAGSWIGLPTARAKTTSYGKSQSFQHAAIRYYTSTGTAHVRVGFSTSVTTPKASDIPYTYRSGCPVGPSSLAMVTLTFRNFDGDDQRGTIVVASSVVSAITSVFSKSYAAGFPFRRVRPVDAYKGSDIKSMAADNTSAFNCRKVTGNPYKVSQHSYGNAIDINTFENPYVAGGTVYPKGSKTYLDRSNYRKGMLAKSGVVAKRFAAMGWPWGARWSEPDYQHFSSNGG